jgi:type IV pilus assembly protein PilB
MSQLRIGELLKKMLRLSEMDVEEVLHEQHQTHRRFGEIALLLGMCAPQDVWNAWFSQLAGHSPWIDLNEFGVDAQAVQQVPAEVARRFNMVPLRLAGNQLVVAIAQDAPLPAPAEVRLQVNKDLRFVRADAAQIQAAIEEHYGQLCVSA